MKILLVLLVVACGGKSAPPASNPTPAPGSASPSDGATCKADADCGEGKKCNECGPNACQQAAEPGTMCPQVCGPAICVPAT